MKILLSLFCLLILVSCGQKPSFFTCEGIEERNFLNNLTSPWNDNKGLSINKKNKTLIFGDWMGEGSYEQRDNSLFSTPLETSISRELIIFDTVSGGLQHHQIKEGVTTRVYLYKCKQTEKLL